MTVAARKPQLSKTNGPIANNEDIKPGPSFIPQGLEETRVLGDKDTPLLLPKCYPKANWINGEALVRKLDQMDSKKSALPRPKNIHSCTHDEALICQLSAQSQPKEIAKINPLPRTKYPKLDRILSLIWSNKLYYFFFILSSKFVITMLKTK